MPPALPGRVTATLRVARDPATRGKRVVRVIGQQDHEARGETCGNLIGRRGRRAWLSSAQDHRERPLAVYHGMSNLRSLPSTACCWSIQMWTTPATQWAATLGGS